MPDLDQRERPASSPEVLPSAAVEVEPTQVERPEVQPENPAPPVETNQPRVVVPTSPTPPPALVIPTKSQLQREVEDVLAEDLLDVYASMTPEEQEKFKSQGEQTASKIAQMLENVRVQSQRVLSLIKDWLKIIPGVNRFFLEQEAKIKTDKILALAETHHQSPPQQ
jgi:hypothetical protein